MFCQYAIYIYVSKECLNSETTVAENAVLQYIGSDVGMNLKDGTQVLLENKSIFPDLY